MLDASLFLDQEKYKLSPFLVDNGSQHLQEKQFSVKEVEHEKIEAVGSASNGFLTFSLA